MCNQIMKKEVQEAISAGEQALQSLYHASEKLENAGKWGIFDMFLGGFFSSYMKHSQIKEAEALLEQAETELQLFQRELSNVGEALHLQIEIGDFLTFADFFLDGFITDYLVQNKISDAREDIELGILHVKAILDELYRKLEGYPEEKNIEKNLKI